jgi:hypothetical protein
MTIMDRDLAMVKRAMSRLAQRDESADIKRHTRRNNELMVQGHMKTVIRKIIEKPDRSSTIEVVDRPEGPITDPEKIDEYLTGEWEKKFQHPEDSLPHYLGLETLLQPDNPLPAAEIWEGFLDDPKKMVAHYAADDRVKVPEPMIRIIASAFSGAAGKGEAEEEIAKVMAKPYTEEELRTQLMRQKKMTGGLTGLNYEIMKMMPGDSFNDLFKIMNRLWRAKHVPEFWTLKGLVGLPKKDEVRSVNDLRPIELIEVTRKLRTAMVLHRLQHALKKRLQANHCRGLSNKGTDTALIQLINLLEDAQEHNAAATSEATDVPLDFTSWDTEKAFDSVGNHVQYASWRRMGVPPDITMWLLKLDMGVGFVLLSSHTKKTLDKLKMAHPKDNRHHATFRQLGLYPERGCTQGDVKSPISWICFFDILVKALNQCQADKYPKARTEASRAAHRFYRQFNDGHVL